MNIVGAVIFLVLISVAFFLGRLSGKLKTNARLAELLDNKNKIIEEYRKIIAELEEEKRENELAKKYK